MGLSRIIAPALASSQGNHALAALAPVAPIPGRQFADKAQSLAGDVSAHAGKTLQQRGNTLRNFAQTMQRKRLNSAMQTSGSAAGKGLSTGTGQNSTDAAPVFGTTAIASLRAILGMNGGTSKLAQFRNVMKQLDNLGSMPMSARTVVHGMGRGLAR